MDYQYLQKQLFWIIPNENFENTMLDGELLFDGTPYVIPKVTGMRHLECFSKFFDALSIDMPYQKDLISCALTLAKYGFAVVLNSGKPVEGKYFAGIILPAQMSEKQCLFFDNIYFFLSENYHDHLLSTAIYTEEKLTYPSAYRDLQIEKEISGGVKNASHLSLLYEEIERQKKQFKKKSV